MEQKKYSLVIVDDEEKIAEGIACLFPWNELGFEVAKVCKSGKEALQYVLENEVDVLLSDIEMPDINGLELCAQLVNNSVKVVFISSYQNYEYFRAAIQYQVEDYILKPVKFEELRECILRIKEKLECREQIGDQEPNETYYEKIIHEVKNYIEENYKNASLEEIAGKVNLSTGYLSKIFKEKSGKGFLDYLVEVRMRKACELLDDIHFKSYEVAFYIGYDNPKNFSRAFKAYYGKTPKEYRNSCHIDVE